MDILDDMPKAYAMDTDNAELIERANNTKSDYLCMSNEDFELKVKQVIGLFETHLQAVDDYRMSPRAVEGCESRLCDRFLVFRGKPRSYQVASSAATLGHSSPTQKRRCGNRKAGQGNETLQASQH